MKLSYFLVLFNAAIVQSARKSQRGSSLPNILILFVDDWGYGDLGENCLHAAEVPGATTIDKEVVTKIIKLYLIAL